MRRKVKNTDVTSSGQKMLLESQVIRRESSRCRGEGWLLRMRGGELFDEAITCVYMGHIYHHLMEDTRNVSCPNLSVSM